MKLSFAGGLAVCVTIAAVGALGSGEGSSSVASASVSSATPIKHVVILYQENHSFNNVLGAWCVQTQRCVGATTGVVSTGQTVALSAALDVVPVVSHGVNGQTTAIDGGKMDKYDLISGCGAPSYACYSQYEPTNADGTPNTAVQNVLALANQFAVSDMTFESGPVPSWGAHVGLATAGNLSGFEGANPNQNGNPAGPGSGPGWGCDSGLTSNWSSTGSGAYVLEPSCIPAPAGSSEVSKEPAAVKASPVQWVPTIMDRLNAARQSWKIYAASKTDGDYQWAVCPTFADCLYTPQAKKMVPTANILTDATSGTLPNFSIVLPAQGPSGSTSQHNGDSMQVGDNWIGQVVSALEGGPEWKSTAVLLTWDDCGCFYDEVSPPAGSNLGIRVPMILISPWAKSGYTDSTPASVASMLSFTEHVLGLPSLNSTDQSAYNYLNAFNFSQTPLAISNNQVAMKVAPESAASKAWIRAHPPNLNDPT